MSKTSMLVLLTGLVIGISGIAFFLYGMNSKAAIPVASISESMNSNENISSEGVKVRGDWEVTVSDPDGSNPIVYNFQNKILRGAFNLISRGLLPADHQEKMALISEGWSIHLFDDYGSKDWLICKNGGAAQDDGDSSVLLVEPTRSESLKQYLSNSALEYYDGITLTGSCLVNEPPDDDSDTPIEINKVIVRTLSSDPSNVGQANVADPFAEKTFGIYADDEDPIIVNAPGQMVSMTVNFTFE